MRSSHADRFNHDADAATYDADVADESNPIRAGYAACLDWVARQVPAGAAVVVDLGSGTGNLAVRIPPPSRLICVDISTNMAALARDKLAGRECEYVCADLLECLDDLPVADAIVSSYAIHHLTDSEKTALFEGVHRRLAPGGVAAFGDLMFESRAAARELLASYPADLAATIREEFFWYVDEAVAQLARTGFEATSVRFSELSWGIVARRHPRDPTGRARSSRARTPRA